MGQHRINDDGHMRWFENDEDYYAFRKARDQFDSADEYDQLRAYFHSDAELVAYLERRADDGYQQWLAYNGGTNTDSEERYREYNKRSEDGLYQSWLELQYQTHDTDYYYQQYLDEKGKFGSADEFSTHISSLLEQRYQEREQACEEQRQKTKKVIDTVFGVAVAIVLALGLSNHWSIVVIAVIVIVLFVASRIVSKKMLDNIY